MEMISRYESVLNKYGFDALKADYLSELDTSESRNNSVGVFGEGNAVIQLLVDLFGLEELNDVLFPGAFQLKILHGEEKKYCSLENDTETTLSQHELIEKLSDTGGLDTTDTVFHGNIYLPDYKLKDVEVNAYTLGESIDERKLIQTDVCVVVLSASRMLSIKERALIKNPLCKKHCFFIGDIDKLQVEERDQVIDLLAPYTKNGEKYYVLPCREFTGSVFSNWVQLLNVEMNRQEAVDAYYKPKIAELIQKQIEDAVNRKDLIKGLLQHMESAKKSLPEYKTRAVRYINTHYIEGLKTNTSSDIISFYERLNQSIVDGVKEERNVKELQEELPHYIAGEWTEYIDKNLSVRLNKQLDDISPAIEVYINEKVAQFLEEILTQEEFNYLNELVRKGISDGQISDHQASNISGNNPLDKRESTTVRQVLPKCLIALGGIAVLTSSFIPGALLILAGFKGNKDAVDDMQEELIEAGKKLNHEYLKEAQGNLEELMKQIRISTELTSERCFTDVVDSLLNIISGYREDLQSLEEMINGLNADLSAL